jgi:hypothetical protein
MAFLSAEARSAMVEAIAGERGLKPPLSKRHGQTYQYNFNPN